MKNSKQIWFEVTRETTPQILEKVYQLNYSILFIPFGLLNLIKKLTPPKKCSLAILVENKVELYAVKKDKEILDKVSHIFINDFHLKEELTHKEENILTGFFIGVNDHSSLIYATEIAKDFDTLLIHFKDPTNIPLELVLASTQNSKVQIVKKVMSSQDGKVSFQTMEHGSDSILISSNKLNEIIELDNYFKDRSLIQLNLFPAEVTNIKHAGMGERVCIDTTSELYQDEGMILGSTSLGGLVTCSETHYLPYMNTRPFRINAGGLHLYAWGPNNMTYYLSDLKAGDEILITNSKGLSRVVTIGRMKIERRPLLLIEAKIGNDVINTFIQDDWHVRMMGANGEIIPSAEIKKGDKLLGFLDKSGRHVGIQINETIKEK